MSMLWFTVQPDTIYKCEPSSPILFTNVKAANNYYLQMSTSPILFVNVTRFLYVLWRFLYVQLGMGVCTFFDDYRAFFDDSLYPDNLMIADVGNKRSPDYFTNRGFNAKHQIVIPHTVALQHCRTPFHDYIVSSACIIMPLNSYRTNPTGAPEIRHICE